jgi:hypothetical protein
MIQGDNDSFFGGRNYSCALVVIVSPTRALPHESTNDDAKRKTLLLLVVIDLINPS